MGQDCKSELQLLEARVSASWKNIAACREESMLRRAELQSILEPQLESEDTAVVVYGSLARQEFTGESDLDWTFLVDGQANSDHLRVKRQIEKLFSHGFRPPGTTKTFGDLTFSHDLIHRIGGQDDTNKNTTQRVLLILESMSAGPKGRGTYERVLKGVLNRYLEEDVRLVRRDGRRYRVPRFLLNDVVRFWRTMAVDFASKHRDQGEAGWGIRNVKLRMSRKLIFAAGLLTCFNCSLDEELQASISGNPERDRLTLVSFLEKSARRTPLDFLAEATSKTKVKDETRKSIFDAYDDFLGVIRDSEKRNELKNLSASDAPKNNLFQNEIRDISCRFQQGLESIFFDDQRLGPLVREFGVF